MRTAKVVMVGVLFAAAGCGEFIPTDLGGGGGGGVSGQGNVTGRVAGQSYDFDADRVTATFQYTGSSEGDLAVELCANNCRPDASGAIHHVSLFVHGFTSDLTAGHTFTVGQRGVFVVADAPGGSQQSVSGEIRVDSAELRSGGTVVGTFNVSLPGGGMVKGFFEAPFVSVAGEPVARNDTTNPL